MRKLITGKLTSGLLCVFMVLSVFFSTGVFAATTEADTSADVTNTAAVGDIGVEYWGHVENYGDKSYVNGPAPMGTRGLGLRVEGFSFRLTGDVPAGANIVYRAHVENEGWMTPVKNGTFAGTRGEGQRIESIEISLENLPGYDVYYRGHVQNKGDIPKANGEWGWVKNGAKLGSEGEALRLEEIQVKIVKQPTTTTTYDKAGTFGPATGSEDVAGDAIINVPGVTLQNLHIKGNLTIGEGVGSGDVTLNNVTVDGDTYVNGGGKNSIHINGGSYNKITVEKTATGEVRIVAIGVDGLEVVISEDATGEAIILEGDFADVTVNAPDVNISTQGDTTIENMNVGEEATGCEVTLAEGTSVGTMVLDSGADVKGKGTIADAQVNADGVKFETAPTKQEVDPSVVTPPVVVPPVVPGGGGGSGGPTQQQIADALEEVNDAQVPGDMRDALEKNALTLGLDRDKEYPGNGSLTYNTLQEDSRRTAIAADMLANKPASPGYTLNVVQNYFDNLTHARIVIETQLNVANSYYGEIPTEDQIEDGVDFIDSIYTQLDGFSDANKELKLSNNKISTLIGLLDYAREQYGKITDLTDKQNLLEELFKNEYSSLNELLTNFENIYHNYNF